MIGVLAAAGVLLFLGGAHELIGTRSRDGELAGRLLGILRGRDRSVAAESLLLGAPERIGRAGLSDRVPVAAILIARAVGAAIGLVVGLGASPAAPGRLSWVVLAAMPAAGFLSPDALLERSARLRRERVVAALPDALDLLAVSAATGRSSAAGFADMASAGEGPLAVELAIAAAEISCGVPQDRVLRALRQRISGSEVATLVAAIERSRRYGSPLADQLRRQASSLRVEGRRRVEERAARAAPKIQLVVALVLVPSVLLMIAAGLIANADVLLAGF